MASCMRDGVSIEKACVREAMVYIYNSNKAALSSGGATRYYSISILNIRLHYLYFFRLPFPFPWLVWVPGTYVPTCIRRHVSLSSSKVVRYTTNVDENKECATCQYIYNNTITDTAWKHIWHARRSYLGTVQACHFRFTPVVQYFLLTYIKIKRVTNHKHKTPGKHEDTTPKRRDSPLNYLDQTQTMARKLG